MGFFAGMCGSFVSHLRDKDSFACDTWTVLSEYRAFLIEDGSLLIEDGALLLESGALLSATCVAKTLSIYDFVPCIRCVCVCVCGRERERETERQRE